MFTIVLYHMHILGFNCNSVIENPIIWSTEVQHE